MRYSDEQRVERILEYAEKLMRYVEENHIDRQMIEENYGVQWAITTPLYNIGEHAYNLAKAFKDKTPQIQWSMISGLRHRLVHDYDGTNWKMISDIIFTEIPELAKRLRALHDEKRGEENG